MCGGARFCETRMLRHGRESFTLREGLHSHCLRLRLRPVELAVDAGRRSWTLCQRGAISRSATISSTVAQAVSQSRQVTRASSSRGSVLVAHLRLSTGFAGAFLPKWKKTPPFMAEGMSDLSSPGPVASTTCGSSRTLLRTARRRLVGTHRTLTDRLSLPLLLRSVRDSLGI